MFGGDIFRATDGKGISSVEYNVCIVYYLSLLI